MAYTRVIYEKKDHVAHITFNRPDALNSYDTPMMLELVDVWKDFGEDRDMRVAIVTAKGRAFCAGRDLKELKELDVVDKDISDVAAYTPKKAGVFKPVICAVNGICAGGGLRFLLESDVPICAEEAVFIDPHVSVGVPAEREMLGLSRRIGYYHALRMGLMGSYERIPARRALELGIVTEVVPQEQLLPRAQELATTIGKNAPLALQGAVEIMWRSQNLGLDDSVRVADQVLRWIYQTEDFHEGPRAFSEKRLPQWKGR
ncbi:MAG: enoyl-CoA hydratase/isomerase family protein [Chloroflexi bacterium]|nr:enoyl-CoA hydratase/isomerase family protein [Chloroflexota bacterium]